MPPRPCRSRVRGRLDAAQLVDRAARRRVLAEAQGIHLAHDLQPRLIVEREPRLIKQPVGSRAARLARGIESVTRLSDPDQQGSRTCRQGHGGMGNARPRFEHQANDAAHRDVDAHAVFVDDHEGPVEHVETAPLEKQDRGTILDRDRAGRRQASDRAPHSEARPISIRPQP